MADEQRSTTSSHLERIRRLERLEVERIEEHDRREADRRARIEGAKPAGGRHDVVERIEHLTRYPMTLLGVAWLVVAIVTLTRRVNGGTTTVLVGVLFGLWALMAAEYLVRLAVCPDRRGYLRRRWVEPATVVVPVFQGWHVLGMERVTLLVHEGALRVESIMRHHSLFRVLGAAIGTVFLGAWLTLLFEDNAAGANIHSYPTALWWAVVTVTTVGYGDRFPVTAGGRSVAVVLMLLGIGLIGVLTATVASVFVKEHTDANKEEVRKSHKGIGDQLVVLSARLADVERRLGASASDLATVDAGADAGPDGEGDGETDGG